MLTTWPPYRRHHLGDDPLVSQKNPVSSPDDQGVVLGV